MMRKSEWVPITPQDVVVLKYGVVDKTFVLPIADFVVQASKKSKSEVRRLMKSGAVQMFIWQKYE